MLPSIDLLMTHTPTRIHQMLWTFPKVLIWPEKIVCVTRYPLVAALNLPGQLCGLYSICNLFLFCLSENPSFHCTNSIQCRGFPWAQSQTAGGLVFFVLIGCLAALPGPLWLTSNAASLSLPANVYVLLPLLEEHTLRWNVPYVYIQRHFQVQ